ncbi:caspase family protein [Oscillatoria sp. FACHB-1406]|uniref:caspase family protein n=1 Tax=Oscillatoria sp. FACHB-1406 TaxID=2692846 RepID=UPI001688E924|nr:caspase family protein [Oscillatoria sp. FACHB-1406]MBD2577325.1 caspase family protein [Oscillatoria sp. FACHB-1406]
MAKNWAICVGINQYAHLQPLRYAREDARQMHEFLKTESFNRILLLCDGNSEPKTYPSCNNLWHALNSIKDQDKAAHDGDTFNIWFFFSGHGMRFNGKDYLMPGEQQRVLLPPRPKLGEGGRGGEGWDDAITNTRA